MKLLGLSLAVVLLVLMGVITTSCQLLLPPEDASQDDPVSPTDDEDIYETSESRNQPLHLRIHEEDSDEDFRLSESITRPIRRRPGRRRPLDPERRRQLLLRRQRLGLPIRKRLRLANQDTALDDKGEGRTSFDTTSSGGGALAHRFTTVAPTTTTTTTTAAPTTSTTAKSLFPSFSAASRLRQRFKKIRDRWGMKTNPKDEDDSEEKDAATSLRISSLSARRRGVARILNRPMDTDLDTSSRLLGGHGDAVEQDKRLRYRPVLVRKKLRSKVKVTTPSPELTSYAPDAPFYESDPPVYNRDYDTELPPVRTSNDNDYETDERYRQTDLSARELVTKPRQTPVPKKVVFDPVTQPPKKRFDPPSRAIVSRPIHTSADRERTLSNVQDGSIYAPGDHTYAPVGPTYSPTTASHTSEPTYVREVAYVEDIAHTPQPTYALEPAYVEEQSYIPEPVYAPGTANTPEPPSYVPNHAYVAEPIYTSDPVYAPEPAYLQEPVYVAEPPQYVQESEYLSDNEYNDYEDEDYEDRSGIYDGYKYGYSVASEDTANYHSRSEARDGETVSGSYKVALPDGRVQVVTYVADDNGFRAEVNYEGEATTPKPTHFEDYDEDLTKTSLTSSRKSPLHSQSLNQQHSSNVRQPQPSPSVKAKQSVLHRQSNRAQPVQAIHSGNQKLRFLDDVHVTTSSPNPFRLVVEKARASTYVPPRQTTTLRNSQLYPVITPVPITQATPLHSTPIPYTPTPIPVTPTPASSHDSTPIYDIVERPTTTQIPTITTDYPNEDTYKPVTNGHVMSNGFHTTEPSSIRPDTHSNRNYYRAQSSRSTFTTANPNHTTTPKSTNGHTMIPAHKLLPDASDVSSTTPASAPVYEYTSGTKDGRHTTLYNPNPNTSAYIHALGKTHAVPLLMPYQSHSHQQQPGLVPHHQHTTSSRHNSPRTYYLNQPVFEGQPHVSSTTPRILAMIHHTTPIPSHFRSDSVEILSGDSNRPRLSLKVPFPHEADIYPAPRPLLRLA